MDPIFHFAQGFYDIGYNAAYRCELEKGVTGFQRIPTAVVNFNFAAELYLKGIHFSTTKYNLQGHQIWNLFKKLPIEIKLEIESNYENLLKNNEKHFTALKAVIKINDEEPKAQRLISCLKDLLIIHNTSFEDWRYLYEKSRSVEYYYDFYKMDCFIKSLIMFINKNHKNK